MAVKFDILQQLLYGFKIFGLNWTEKSHDNVCFNRALKQILSQY